MGNKRRGAGYCMNSTCATFGKLFMLGDLPDTFECPTCLRPARLERERGIRHGDGTVFDEVRVEFDFDPIYGIYRQAVRIRDGRLLGRHDVYTLQSPLMETREEALRVGKLVLRNMNVRLERPDRPPRSSRTELVEQGWTVLV
jgi:hypothetical protein